MTARTLLILGVAVSAVFSAELSLTQSVSSLKNTLAKLSENENEEDRPTHCFSCTSIDASEIVGGAGVHPGVYLTSILLSTIPVTKRCHDPFFSTEAKQVGVAMPMCEDGLCVKINYTDKYSGKLDVLRACLPRSKGVFKQVCTRFASSQAEGTWCVCDDDLCNMSPSTFPSLFACVVGLTAAAFIRLLP